MSSQALAVPEQIQEVRKALEVRKATFTAMLPKHVPVEKFLKSVLVAVMKNPELLACDRSSLFQSVTQACQLGLDPSGTLGSAYIIPYKGRATLVPGYRGLIDLARRSGQILSIAAHVVRVGDDFEYELGLNPKLVHRPNLENDKPAPLRLAYAVAKLRDGGEQLEVMTKAQIDQVRDKSPAGRSGPWKDHYDEMARKTVVRRLVKWLPISTEQLAAAMRLDEETEGDSLVEGLIVDLETPPPSSRAEDMRTRLEADVPDREPGTE